MKKKLKLTEMKVQSFTTEVNLENLKTAKGGVTNPFCTTWMITNAHVNLTCWETDTAADAICGN